MSAPKQAEIEPEVAAALFMATSAGQVVRIRLIREHLIESHEKNLRKINDWLSRAESKAKSDPTLRC